MIKSVGIISKPNRPRVAEVAPGLVTWLRSRGLDVYYDRETSGCMARPPGTPGCEFAREELPARVDLLIVLGGDGTLLSVARLIGGRDVPVLPVNLGGLGFLTSVTLDELYPQLEMILAGRHQTSERMLLEAALLRGGKEMHRHRALNDAVVTKGAKARILDFDVTVDDDFVSRYRADGLIVSTPTGSTAYSLAAGGPIVFPRLDCFIITPICPHMLTNRPLVLPDRVKVTLDFAPVEEPAFLTLDGQVGLEVLPGDRVEVTKAQHKIHLVRPAHKTYFEILRSKLHWGER